MTDDLGIPYGLRRGPSGELGLLIEGCRHNLLLHSNDIEKLIPELRDVRSGTVRSIFAGETCAAFSCDTTQSFSISFEVENSLQRSDFSVSLFGVLASLPLKDAASTIPVPFEMSVSDGRETKVTTGCLEKEWRRHDCGFHFASRPRRLSCAFRTLPNRVLLTPIAYQFSLTGLCAEEGLFPSMPIVTNGAIGVRAPDRLSFSGSEALSQFKSAGTLVLVYRPQWTPSQLTPGINPCVFEALFDEGQQGIRLVHDSHNNAQLRLDVWGDGGKTIKSFDGNRPPPSNDVFAIYFGWENQKFSLRLDGDLVFEGELDRSISELDEFYLASRKGDDEASLFAHLKQFSIYSALGQKRPSG